VRLIWLTGFAILHRVLLVIRMTMNDSHNLTHRMIMDDTHPPKPAAIADASGRANILSMEELRRSPVNR